MAHASRSTRRTHRLSYRYLVSSRSDNPLYRWCRLLAPLLISAARKEKLMSTISVPIDASQVPAQEREAQRVRVAARSGNRISSTVVSVGSGKATAKMEIEGSGPITIAVGPEP